MKPAWHPPKAALVVLLSLAVATFGSAAGTLAQDRSEARGAKGPIGKQDLIEALDRQKYGGSKVAGHVVTGPDVIDILSQGDMPIELRDCIIEGGLDFSGVAVVDDPITIENCEIRAAPMTRALSAGSAVYARGTRFDRQVNIRSSILAGPADLTGAEFRKNAIFPETQFTQVAYFGGVQFAEAAHFSLAHFNSVHFDAASFGGEAAFRRAQFDEPAHFDRATFAGRADFREAVFRAEQTFLATFKDLAIFDRAEFEQHVGFSTQLPTGLILGASFEHNADFAGTRFKGGADFSDQVFPARARFNEAEFGKEARFARARFYQRAAFGNTKFIGSADFAKAAFDQLARFQSAAFLGASDFSAVRFGDEAIFVDAYFQGPSRFVFSQMEGLASFRGTEFGQAVDLDGVAFREFADFQGARFKGPLSFTGADFGTYADFRDARIPMLDLNSVDNPTILRSRLDMRGARIGEVHVQEVIFEADVDFSDATFGLPAPDPQGAEESASGTTILRSVTFEDDVSFARARFAGRLAVENVKFQRTADFTDADFSGIARDGAPSFAFSYVDFGDLRMRWPQLPEPRYWVQSQEHAIRGTIEPAAPVGKPEPMSRALSELEGSFRAADHLEDANAAYYERKLAELREARAGGWNTARLLLEAEWLFWGLVCGYGTKLWWALGWALLADLIFTLVYWSSASVTRRRHPGTEEEFSFRLRLLDLPKQYAADRADLPVPSGPLRKLIDSLRVSTVILFKLGYRDTTLGGRCGPLPIAYLVALEWALGFYLLAALTVTLANTQPLINRLISGVF